MSERILVADDEKEIRELVEIYLKSEGFHIDTVSNGEEAVKAVKEKDRKKTERKYK